MKGPSRRRFKDAQGIEQFAAELRKMPHYRIGNPGHLSSGERQAAERAELLPYFDLWKAARSSGTDLRAMAARAEIQRREATFVACCKPRVMDFAAEERRFQFLGDLRAPHTLQYHGPDIPLLQPRLPSGEPDLKSPTRTLEGRLLDAPTWADATCSHSRAVLFKWLSHDVLNRAGTAVLRKHADRIFLELARTGVSRIEVTGDSLGIKGLGVGLLQSKSGKQRVVTSDRAAFVIWAEPYLPVRYIVRTAFPQLPSAQHLASLSHLD